MRLVVLSTNPPRRCGLATFAADLTGGLAASVPSWQVRVCAVDRDRLEYGPEVLEVLRQDDRTEYRRVARALAAHGTDLVLIQHEYNIFGGPDGSYVLDFAAELVRLGVPYAVTLHTVTGIPTPGQAAVVAGLCRQAARVTVFTETARQVALAGGWVDPARCVVVPHGVPAALTAPVSSHVAGPTLARALAAAGDDRVLSTFGLLRRGKALEVAVRALPEVVARHPRLRYVIAGATHPETRRASGEAYRDELARLAHELGVGGHVLFVDDFLSEPELAVLLARTEICLTPYRSPEQSCSGALTFALAAGCAVVSTAYRYAVDLVTPADGPPLGELVPFDDPPALAAAVCGLLDDDPRLTAARRAARRAGEGLTWPMVGARFAQVCTAAAGPSRRLDVTVPGGEPAWPHTPTAPSGR